MEPNQEILKKLERIEREVILIKQHMVDVDRIMTEEDYEALLTEKRNL